MLKNCINIRVFNIIVLNRFENRPSGRAKIFRHDFITIIEGVGIGFELFDLV